MSGYHLAKMNYPEYQSQFIPFCPFAFFPFSHFPLSPCLSPFASISLRKVWTDEAHIYD